MGICFIRFRCEWKKIWTRQFGVNTDHSNLDCDPDHRSIRENSDSSPKRETTSNLFRNYFKNWVWREVPEELIPDANPGEQSFWTHWSKQMGRFDLRMREDKLIWNVLVVIDSVWMPLPWLCELNYINGSRRMFLFCATIWNLIDLSTRYFGIIFA